MDDEQLQELLNCPVDSVNTIENKTFVTFKNGKRLELNGTPFSLDDVKIETCNFCGDTPSEDPLFTIDNSSFICKKCVALAFETFMKNGISMPLTLKLKETKKNEKE